MANWHTNTTYCLIELCCDMKTKHFHPKYPQTHTTESAISHHIIPNFSLQIIPNLMRPEHSQLVLLVCGGLNYQWTSIFIVLVLQSFKLKLKTHFFK